MAETALEEALASGGSWQTIYQMVVSSHALEGGHTIDAGNIRADIISALFENFQDIASNLRLRIPYAMQESVVQGAIRRFVYDVYDSHAQVRIETSDQMAKALQGLYESLRPLYDAEEASIAREDLGHIYTAFITNVTSSAKFSNALVPPVDLRSANTSDIGAEGYFQAITQADHKNWSVIKKTRQESRPFDPLPGEQEEMYGLRFMAFDRPLEGGVTQRTIVTVDGQLVDAGAYRALVARTIQAAKEAREPYPSIAEIDIPNEMIVGQLEGNAHTRKHLEHPSNQALFDRRDAVMGALDEAAILGKTETHTRALVLDVDMATGLVMRTELAPLTRALKAQGRSLWELADAENLDPIITQLREAGADDKILENAQRASTRLAAVNEMVEAAVNALFEDKTPAAEEQKQFFMNIAGTGAGKSTMEAYARRKTNNNLVEINLDDNRFFLKLFEYNMAAGFHRDDYISIETVAKEIRTRAIERAREEGYHVGNFSSGIPYANRNDAIVAQFTEADYVTTAMAGHADLIMGPEEMRGGPQGVIEGVKGRLTDRGRAVPMQIVIDKNIRAYPSAVAAARDPNIHNLIYVDLKPKEAEAPYLLGHQVTLTQEEWQALQSTRAEGGQALYAALDVQNLLPNSQEFNAESNHQVNPDQVDVYPLYTEGENVTVFVTIDKERLKDPANQALMNRNARGKDTLFVNTHPNIAGHLLALRDEVNTPRPAIVDILQSDPNEQDPRKLALGMLKYAFDEHNVPDANRMMGVERLIALISEQRVGFNRTHASKETHGTYDSMSADQLLQNMITYQPSITAHPTDPFNEATREAAIRLQALLEGASKGYLVDPKNGRRYTIGKKGNRVQDTDVERLDATAYEALLRDQVLALYASMEMTPLRDNLMIYGYAQPTHKLIASEESDRILDTSKRGYDSIPEAAYRKAQAYVNQSGNTYASVQDLIAQEPEIFRQIVRQILQNQNWGGDQDNKPLNTAKDVENFIMRTEFSVVGWYMQDLVQVRDIIEESPEIYAKIDAIIGKLGHYEYNGGGLNVRENTLEDINKQIEKVALDGEKDSPKHAQLKRMQAMILRVPARGEGYRSAKEFENDLIDLDQMLREQNIRPGIVYDSNGQDTGMSLLDGLMAKAENFGNVASKTQVRQTSDVHAKVFDAVFRILTHYKSHDSYREVLQSLDETDTSPGVREKNLLDVLQKDTEGTIRTLIREELLGNITKGRSFPDEAKEGIRDALINAGLEGDLEKGEKGIFYQTLKTMQLANDNPYAVGAVIVSHSYADPEESGKHEALRSQALLELVENPAFLSQEKRHKPTVIQLKEDLAAIERVPTEDGTVMARSAIILRENLKNPHYNQHIKDTSKSTKNPNWRVYDPEHEGADSTGTRPMTIAEAKQYYGYPEEEISDNDKATYLKGTIISMVAGSDFGRENGGYEHYLVERALQGEIDLALKEGYFVEIFRGVGTSGQYRQGGRTDAPRRTDQGIGQVLYATQEAFALESEGIQARAVSRGIEQQKQGGALLQAYSDAIEAVFNEGQPYKPSHASRISNRDGLILNPSNVQLLPQINKRDARAKPVVDYLDEAAFRASKYVQRLMEDKHPHAEAYTELFRYGSPTQFTKWYNTSNRPDTGKSQGTHAAQQHVTEEESINALEEAVQHFFTELHGDDWQDKTKDPKVSKQRAIGYGGTLGVMGLDSNAYEGISAFLDLRHPDGSLKQGALTGERPKDLDKFVLATELNVELQDMMGRKILGMMNANLPAAWRFAGFERVGDNHIRHLDTEETYNIETLAKAMDQDPPEYVARSGEGKSNQTLPAFVHMLAHFDQEYQISTVNIIDALETARGKPLDTHARKDLLEKAAHSPDDIQKELFDRVPQHVRDEVQHNREGSVVTRHADEHHVGGTKQAQMHLADAWRQILKNGGLTDSYQRELDSGTLSRAEAEEATKQSLFGLYANVFVNREQTPASMRFPQMQQQIAA